MRLYRLFFILVLFPVLSFAQTITGIVLTPGEGAAEPLPGVHVYWEDQRQGTVTDEAGHFSIGKGRSRGPLVFSFVGYHTHRQEVAGSGHLEVMLVPDLTIGEVVVEVKNRGTYLAAMDPIHTEKITGAELHKAACCNLAESFETNPSVDVSYNDAITGAKQIRLLGLDGTYSRLQTENIPNFRGLATTFGLTYIPGPWMESIQVSKGTSSVVNGYESVTGQINVDFKKPDSSEKLHLNLFGTADGKLEFNGNGNFRLYKDKLTTGLFLHAENLSNKIDHNGDGFLDHPTGDQYHLFNVWKYNNHSGFMVHGAFRYLADNRYGGQADFIRNAPPTAQDPYGTSIRNNLAEAVFKAGYVWPSQHAALALLSNGVTHALESAYGLTRYDARENRLYANLVLTLDLDARGHHLLNTGTSYLYDRFDEILGDRSMDRFESVPGFFAEYTFRPSDRFTLMSGIRYDLHNLHGNFVTPRFHLRYQPFHRLTLRASAGKGFRSAQVLAENSFLLSNYRKLLFDESVREEAWNYGASVTGTSPLCGRDLQVTAEFYRTSFLQQLVVDRETSASHILLKPLEGSSFANSFQIDLRYPVVRNLDLTLAWRLNDVKQTIGGRLLEKPFTSRYKGLVSANYTTRLKKWMFDYTLQLNGGGRLPVMPGVAAQATAQNHKLRFPAYNVMNAQITRYFRYWSVYAGGENLTGFMQDQPVLGADRPFEPGFDATHIWGPVMGRRLYLGLRFTLNYP